MNILIAMTVAFGLSFLDFSQSGFNLVIVSYLVLIYLEVKDK